MPNVMAAQPNIGGALCESSVIPFLVPRHRVQLTTTAQVSCSHTVNTGERMVNFAAAKFRWGQEPPKMYIQWSSPGDG